MNQKHQRMPEQIAFEYRDRTQPSSTVSPHREADMRTGGRRLSHINRYNAPDARQRNVHTPEVMAQPMTWSERQARYRRPPAQSRGGNRLVKRTLAHTGVPAPEGQVRIVRPLPQSPMRSAVPVRSGRRVRKAGFWRRFLGMFAVLVLAIVAISFALFSPNFHVRQVTVAGSANPTLVHSIQTMGMQGQNIFLIDIASLTARIDAQPMVDSASIEKQWPDQLTVTVVERLPILLWQAQNKTFSVDSHGVIIGLASDTVGATHLMTVVDTRSKALIQSLQPGAHLNAGDVTFALQVFERLPQVAGVTTFTLRYGPVTSGGGSSSNGNGSFIVASPQGWIAYLGGADDTNPLDNRLIELQQILTRAQQQQLNLATIDLRFALHPVFTVKP